LQDKVNQRDERGSFICGKLKKLGKVGNNVSATAVVDKRTDEC